MIAERELNEKMEAGEVEEIKGNDTPSLASENEVDFLQPTIADYESFLGLLKKLKQYGTGAPTYTPKSFIEQFYFRVDGAGGTTTAYLHFNGVWNRFATDHGSLLGLDGNDHGAIYYTEAEVNTLIAARGEWILVDSGAYTTTQTLTTTLVGNTDHVYKIVLTRQSDTVGYFQMSFNNDTTINHYYLSGITVNNGTRIDETQANAAGAGFQLDVSTRRATEQDYVEIIIYAKSGKNRAFSLKRYGISGTDVILGTLAGVWANSADELTRVDIIDAAGADHTGTWAIYKANSL